jgi:hypothetical protein
VDDEGLTPLVSGSLISAGFLHGRATRALILLLTFAGGFGLRARAQELPTEYQVKAAYLFNFARFIKWKVAPVADGSFAICVLGVDPFGDALQRTVSGEKIDGRPVTTRHIRNTAEVQGCSIVFVSSSERSRLRSLLPQLASAGALTVSDLPDFADGGGMIEFVLQENRVRFRVNLAAAEKAGLTVSSELLRVAVAVKRESGD